MNVKVPYLLLYSIALRSLSLSSINLLLIHAIRKLWTSKIPNHSVHDNDLVIVYYNCFMKFDMCNCVNDDVLGRLIYFSYTTVIKTPESCVSSVLCMFCCHASLLIIIIIIISWITFKALCYIVILKLF